MRKDPVCGMTIKKESAFVAEYEGQIFYFCSEGCRRKFSRERASPSPRSRYELIIIGGGPAGLTAAVYASSLRIDACLISQDLGGQAIDSTKIENYMGFDFIDGPQLVEKFERQLIHSHYIDHRISAVEAVEAEAEGFLVRSSAGESYQAKCLIVATGMTRRKLGVPGEEEFQRRGIFYGNIPDLSFVEGEEAAVIGGGNTALQIVENLQPVARKIHLISISGLKADPAIIDRVSRHPDLCRYEGYETVEFTGQKTLTAVTVRKKGQADSKILPVKGAFIAIGLQPNATMVPRLVAMNGHGEIRIGPDCSTSCRGLFAAGDVTDAYGKRIIIAAGEGAKAAIAAKDYLLYLKKRKVRRKSFPPLP